MPHISTHSFPCLFLLCSYSLSSHPSPSPAPLSVQLASANLSVVEALFSDMFSADAEMAKLRFLPGLQEVVEAFKLSVQAIAESFKANGLAKHAGKTKQVRRTTDADRGAGRALDRGGQEDGKTKALETAFSYIHTKDLVCVYVCRSDP